MCYLELYSGEGKEKRKCWLWTVSKATLMWWSVQKIPNNPNEERHYKNTFGHMTNFHCVALFSDMLLKLCAFKAMKPIQPSEYEEVCCFHIHFIDTTHKRCTDTSAFITHTHIHTLITCNHNRDFSSSCEIKGEEGLSLTQYVLRGFWIIKSSV